MKNIMINVAVVLLSLLIVLLGTLGTVYIMISLTAANVISYWITSTLFFGTLIGLVFSSKKDGK